MTNPFDHVGPMLKALEQQEQLEKLLQPSAVERAIEQAQQAQRAAEAFEKLRAPHDLVQQTLNHHNLTNAAIEAAMNRHLTSNAALDVVRGFDVLARVPDHEVLLGMTRTPAYLEAMERASRGFDFAGQHRELLDRFVNPLGDIRRLSELAAARMPFWVQFNESLSWADALADRMATLNVDWALSGSIDASAEAFGRLGRLADLANLATPFVDETAELVQAELGVPVPAAADDESVETREGRYDVAGRERELIAFPPGQYGAIMRSAGFGIAYPAPPVVASVGGLDEPYRYNTELVTVLLSLEAHLRQFIVEKLEATDGDDWKKRLKPGIRDKWVGKAKAAEEKGKPVFPPIYYADFMDLFDLMVGGGHWKIFSVFFPSREALQSATASLYGIRNEVAHARPVCLSDELAVNVHATMLFRSMGLKVLYG